MHVIDIPRQLLYSVRADGPMTALVALDERVSAIVPALGGEWLAVFGRSIGLIDLDTGHLERVLSIPGDSDVLLNDAVSGRDGVLYVGSVDRSGSDRGELYAIDSRLQVTTVVTGIRASNGLDTNSTGEMLAHVDSLRDRLTLGIGGPSVEVPHPDGVAVDAEGYVWVASWGHGEVRRFGPTGELDRVITVPAAMVTNVAFGGTDLEQLFITTAQGGGSELGGAVFYLRPGTHGLDPFPFQWR